MEIINKSEEELKNITDDCYEKCNDSYNEYGSREFFEIAEDYLCNTYPELTFSEKNKIFDTIEDLINKENKMDTEIANKLKNMNDAVLKELVQYLISKYETDIYDLITVLISRYDDKDYTVRTEIIEY